MIPAQIFPNLQPRIKNLVKNITFRKAASVFVFCTFLLSITPKQVLHHAFAHHSDTAVKKTSDKLQLGESGYNCDRNSVVATSPFTEALPRPEIPKPVFIASYHVSVSQHLISRVHFFCELRGPPSA